MTMKPSFDNIMKQAQEMQQKMQQAQRELEQMVVIGEAGGGLVKVKMKGNHSVESVSIDEDSIDPDDKEMLEDLITAAINDAVRKIDKETRNKMSSLTKGLNLPTNLQGSMGE